MKNKFLRVFRIVLIILIICTLSFTFTQSALSKEASTEVSETVKDIIDNVLPSDTPTGDFVQENVREFAHFFEFAALGLLIALYVVLYLPAMGLDLCEKKLYVFLSYVIAPIVPLLDETIQFFSHRVPDVLDVWLDTAGYLSFATLVYAVSFVISVLRKRRAGKTQNNF